MNWHLQEIIRVSYHVQNDANIVRNVEDLDEIKEKIKNTSTKPNCKLFNEHTPWPADAVAAVLIQ